MNKTLGQLNIDDLGKGIELEFFSGGIRGILEGFQVSFESQKVRVTLRIRLDSQNTITLTLSNSKEIILYG